MILALRDRWNVLLKRDIPSLSQSHCKSERFRDTMIVIWCLLFGFIAFFDAFAVDLPKNWKACHVSDKNRGKCLREAAQIAYSSLMEGEKSLGLPSLDPMVVDRTIVKDSGKAKKLLDVTVIMTNYQILGFKSGKVDNFKFDCDKLASSFDISMKDDVIEQGHYNGSGKVMLLPVVGDGDFKYIYHGYKVHGDMTMTPSKKNGVNYLQLGSFALTISVSGARIQFDNLFNGNKLLGDNMNRVFNENFSALYDEIGPSINEDFGRFLGKYVKLIMESIPFNELCPA